MINNDQQKIILRWCILMVSGLLLFSCETVIAKQSLRIYLPREKSLSSDVITLGHVGKMLGDPDIIKNAETITLGQFSLPGQEIQLNRQTILSRLAGSGIHASVIFNGAETISIRREGQCIRPEQFVAAAETCLKKTLADEAIASYKVIHSPVAYPIVCDSNEIMLTAHFSGRQVVSTKRVTVSAMQGKKLLCEQDIIFSVEYRCQRLVATRDLDAGTPLTSENTKTESYLASQPKKAEAALYGMVARRAISAGMEIKSSLVEPKEPVVLVKRRQKVLLRLQTGGLFVSASGEAMNDGCEGQIVEVRRGTGREQRIVTGRVMPDGTVEPIL